VCGLVGIFAYGDSAPPVDPAELRSIRDRMATRGPDGAGEWLSADRRVGLAHRRLAIIDLSEAGAQPMGDPATGNVIVFNGEIYNYRELRRELEAQGAVFRSQSDTEVLLALYRCFGPEMLPKLRGMYAFALWDAKERGLFLARDPFGIKPLYYADDGRTLRVASQVKALRAGGGVDTTPDPAGHVGFFLWGHVPEPFTLYRGIGGLPAGTALWVAGGGRRRTHVFFDLSRELQNASARGAAPPKAVAEARERLREALLDSVRHHLVADVPVGVFLSAGKDSVTVAALAAEVGPGQVEALTLGFREYVNTPLDETPLAIAAATRYGLRHEIRWVTRADFAQALEPLLEAMDQPSIDGVNTYFVARAAREAGWKVALSGLGGDEFFAGYASFEEIPRAVRALRPFAKAVGLGRTVRACSSPLLRRAGLSPKWAGLFEYGGDWAGAYLLRRALYMPWELRGLFEAAFVREGLERLDTLASLRRTVEGLGSDRLRLMALEAAWYMRNQLLRDTDWASMAHGLEVRVPLVDVEVARTVAELCHAGFPPGKRELGGSPRPGLPEAVLARPKTGFTVPVREWLLEERRARTPGVREPRGLRGWARVVYDAGSEAERRAVGGERSRERPVTRSQIGLLATEMGTPGGVQAYMLRLAEALAPDGSAGSQELHCVSLNDDAESLRRHPSLRRCASLRGASRSKVRLVLNLLALPQLDTLIVGHLGPAPVGWFLKAIGRADSYLVVLHGIEAWRRLPWLERRAAQRADLVVATTTYTAREFARLNGIPEDRFRVVPLCADERVQANNTSFRLDGAFKLLCVGRQAASDRYKGFEMIFEALARMPDEPRPHLNLVGAGDDQPRLRAVAARLGVQDLVTFWGVLDDGSLAAAYEDCDVYAMPSKGEGFGIVFLEAMLRGKPCIGGAHGGTPEVIEQGRSGFLVEYGDVDALVRYLLVLRADSELRRRLGARGRELATTRFSAAAFRERWRRLVLGELGGPRLAVLEPAAVGKNQGKVS
jgi:asparagine synthase (glutamine-hydrolysing)